MQMSDVSAFCDLLHIRLGMTEGAEDEIILMPGLNCKLYIHLKPLHFFNAATPVRRHLDLVSQTIKAETQIQFLYNPFLHNKHLHQIKHKRSSLKSPT